MPIWGWGNGEFVGQLQYGIVYKLWNPDLHRQFGGRYQETVQALLACQRRYESPISMLPDECLFYILNMCRWDWFDDTPDNLKVQHRARKRVRRQEERARMERERVQAEAAANDATAAAPIAVGQVEASERSCCDQIMLREGDDNTTDADGDENFYDADESQRGEEADDEDAMAVVADAPEQAINNPNAMDNDGDSSDSDVEVDDWEEDDDDDDAAAAEAPEEEDEASDESEWERQQGYRADNSNFSFRDISPDEEEDADTLAAQAAQERQAWFRRHFARVHILRGLAQGETDVVVDMVVEE